MTGIGTEFEWARGEDGLGRAPALIVLSGLAALLCSVAPGLLCFLLIQLHCQWPGGLLCLVKLHSVGLCIWQPVHGSAVCEGWEVSGWDGGRVDRIIGSRFKTWAFLFRFSPFGCKAVWLTTACINWITSKRHTQVFTYDICEEWLHTPRLGQHHIVCLLRLSALFRQKKAHLNKWTLMRFTYSESANKLKLRSHVAFDMHSTMRYTQCECIALLNMISTWYLHWTSREGGAFSFATAY